MTDNKNIEDVTNSPHDWEDFWYFSSELGLSYQVGEEEMLEELMQERPEFKNKTSNYIQDVLDGKHTICKRESPLSE
jgi:hypothetical protein|tara:strand:+ start:689 stop:919 length:231 start_codon:yes stop_codon:yes gene_type:complete